MTEQHEQYFSYSTKPAQTGACIACKQDTHDFLAYSPPGMIPLERACCRQCTKGALETMRELANGVRALGRTLGRFRRLFGKPE